MRERTREGWIETVTETYDGVRHRESERGTACQKGQTECVLLSNHTVKEVQEGPSEFRPREAGIIKTDSGPMS